MLNANTLFELTPETLAAADAVEGIIEAGIQQGLEIDDETKSFKFVTADISKEIKADHGGLSRRVRKIVVERCTAANWKVVTDEEVGTITLIAKPARKARKPKVVTPDVTK